jgi:hypothetical protein
MENKMTHEQFQAQCMTWYRNTYRLEYRMCFAIDNNVSVRLPKQFMQVEGSRKKSIGVRDGVFDAIFIGYGFIAAIDFKVGNDALSKEQLEFAKQLMERGHKYHYAVYPPLDNFIKLIKWLKQINTGK